MLTRQAYRIPLYSCFVAPVLLLITLPFLPESPRWLLHHHQPEKALRSLRFFRTGVLDEVAIQQEFEEMTMVAARESDRPDWRAFFQIFQGQHLRRTIISVGVGTANAGVGAMFVLAFGTYFFAVVSHSQRN